MNDYNSDRGFTDFIHNKLALKIIYAKMDWLVQDNDVLNDRLRTNIDMNNAVDYIAVDSNRQVIIIQERFRDEYYKNYNDFTIRYMRPENQHEERRLSEYFKLDANYFIYGITDTSKFKYKNASKFLKYAILNLRILKENIAKGIVVIDESLGGKSCKEENGVMRCPIIANTDHSSNFVPFDIIILSRIAPDVIVYQEGYF